MNNFSIIAFIIGLRERDRFIIVLLLAVGTLWTQNIWDMTAYSKLQDTYRETIVSKSDSCANQKMRIMNEYINIIRATNRQVDSMGKNNMFIIENNNKHINASKKLP